MNHDTPDWRDEELGNDRHGRAREGRANEADRANGRDVDPRFTDNRPASHLSESRDIPRSSSPRERLSAEYDDEPVFRRRAASGGLNAVLGADVMTRRLVYGAVAIGAILVLGVGGWSLLGTHSGGVPVIGPPPGPVRDRPVDPGGMQIMGDGTDLDVTGQGEAHLAPEPEQPRADALAARTAPDSSAQEAGTLSDSATDPVAARVGTAATHDASEAASSQEDGRAATQKTDDASGRPAASVSVKQTLPTPTTNEQPVRQNETQSVPPPAKPKVKLQDTKSQPDVGNVKRVATGDHMVQLAALGSDAAANAVWNRLSGQASDLLGDRSPLIEQKTINGRVFYRLRIGGFETTQEARAFCVRLHARAIACTPAVF